MDELKPIIESLLFVSEEPLSVERIKDVLTATDNKDIRLALAQLSEEYETRGGGFYLCEVAGGYQLRSRPTYHEYIKVLLQPSPQKLSRAALETLAVVAYRQPVIRADIEHIRGVDCGAMLRQLMERKLIRVLGRKEIPGRPLIYATTKTFLELFELKDLSALPSPAEIEQMGAVFNSQQMNPSSDDDTTPSAVEDAQTHLDLEEEDHPGISTEGDEFSDLLENRTPDVDRGQNHNASQTTITGEETNSNPLTDSESSLPLPDSDQAPSQPSEDHSPAAEHREPSPDENL